jgi:alpha-D-ribose 1-methylphosphonate 5-triphosphate synthase subunit PhnH
MSAPSLTNTLAAGLQDSVHESQFAFRQVLDALARPGQVRHIGAALPGVALGGAMARLLLSLTDDETTVHWRSTSPEDAHNGSLQTWLRFHTGAPVASHASSASFVVVTQPLQAPALNSCAQGSPESPEFSSTVLMELPSLCDGPALEWRGPGIKDMHRVALLGLPKSFWAQWQANHAAFPQGVDLIFTCAEHALGLPRTTRVRRLEGV